MDVEVGTWLAVFCCEKLINVLYFDVDVEVGTWLAVFCCEKLN